MDAIFLRLRFKVISHTNLRYELSGPENAELLTLMFVAEENLIQTRSSVVHVK